MINSCAGGTEQHMNVNILNLNQFTGAGLRQRVCCRRHNFSTQCPGIPSCIQWCKELRWDLVSWIMWWIWYKPNMGLTTVWSGINRPVLTKIVSGRAKYKAGVSLSGRSHGTVARRWIYFLLFFPIWIMCRIFTEDFSSQYGLFVGFWFWFFLFSLLRHHPSAVSCDDSDLLLEESCIMDISTEVIFSKFKNCVMDISTEVILSPLDLKSLYDLWTKIHIHEYDMQAIWMLSQRKALSWADLNHAMLI